MSMSKRRGAQFKEVTRINVNKSKYSFIASNQVS